MNECPVCGVKIAEDGTGVLTLAGSTPIDPITVVHDGVTYFFDSEDCKVTFESNPYLFTERKMI